jgi:hypothetical protein
MADIILVAVTLAFIAICVGYVNWCDRIIGPDDFGSDADHVLDRTSGARDDATADVTAHATTGLARTVATEVTA